MVRKLKTINFALETNASIKSIHGMIGQRIPLTGRYVAGPKPTLAAIDNDLCTLIFDNGVVMTQVPIRDLVDDLNYWQIRTRQDE